MSPVLQLTCPDCGQWMDIPEQDRESTVLCPRCNVALRASAALPETPQIRCPRCQSKTVSAPANKLSIGGIIVLIAGMCLVPFFGLGLILVIAALWGMKEIKYRCLDCGKWF